MGPENHFVSILEKGAGFTRSEDRLPLTVGAEFHEAAVALLRRARDRAGAEQIAGTEIASATGVVRDQLADSPV